MNFTTQQPARPAARWPARLGPSVLAGDTQAMAFWQSRHKLRDAPQLTDLRALARSIRSNDPCSLKRGP